MTIATVSINDLMQEDLNEWAKKYCVYSSKGLKGSNLKNVYPYDDKMYLEYNNAKSMIKMCSREEFENFISERI